MMSFSMVLTGEGFLRPGVGVAVGAGMGAEVLGRIAPASRGPWATPLGGQRLDIRPRLGGNTPSEPAPKTFLNGSRGVCSSKGHSQLGRCLGGRSRPPREKPAISHTGPLGTIRGFFPFWARKVGPQQPGLCRHLTGGQRQEQSRFTKTFPGLPSD